MRGSTQPHTDPSDLMPATADVPETLIPSEVADLLRADVDTVRRWLRQGHIDGRKIGTKWKIPRSAVVDESGKIRADVGPTYE